ncbi:MAG: DNA-directed RNA polymerase subunit alpha [Candidatus Sungbacteria bacterium RIFCSPLOWO2_02_FULL_47_9]|uniref:DNA-directed RNA polymerase subunit alpha n=1 Tax=Candidatus Sungbacteria bacterium RIFCSPHIGHO2_01_FULL_47_32 TaxID=1802264 RepID=A0A1G2K4V5_9BACT|nr:MAG: DNA-directed RNA polymerase subunit alpha [Parcubacteria group bacterium GW2011_GWA2_47_10]OGZ94425.1 MAG: DNA-directed RNA polymerase subunit alpha [Candidatus Sungbacteria bacterium RIFCSPHIGHO2_01_FULL_47_32]OGZ98017.1 MAG: DNA-directed RNA polymerase subunit alpha [Candidatus Sungbacteria bacterium RIFCSPHIGHO2_02_FULL_46_12]OHA05767.1 MAG: DNA-directed RNA polymerase subunit alpha [Candidatus Sungbacteria bacterium RIFCSPLOWO2_01_FULL_47_32]OHA12170.1 MAG: DNA-directed RNA polymera
MIPLPQKPKVILEEGNRGVYEIEGLYPGYGHTLGNSLRRVLLSSLSGAVITSVKIEGASHEFTTISGVLEDMVEIVLNLKQIRFKMHGDGPHTISVDVKGEREVTSSDFTLPSQLELVTPDVHIVTVTDKKTNFKMDAEVEVGLGYQSVESRKKEKVEIGAVALDASFTPVRAVNYEVENMRVGDRTDFNRLRLHVVTDGSLSPREALKEAALILVSQFQGVVEIFTEGSEPSSEASEEAVLEEGGEEGEEEEVSKKKIEDLDLSTRTMNALNAGGVKTVGVLTKKTEKKLKELEGLGDKGIQEIRRELGNLGLTLKD